MINVRAVGAGNHFFPNQAGTSVGGICVCEVECDIVLVRHKGGKNSCLVYFRYYVPLGGS